MIWTPKFTWRGMLRSACAAKADMRSCARRVLRKASVLFFGSSTASDPGGNVIPEAFKCWSITKCDRFMKAMTSASLAFALGRVVV